MTVGYSTLTVEDNGGSVVTVPTQSVQLVIGMSSAGVAYTPFSTRSQSTIETNIGYGPVLEAAMLMINGGGNNLAGGTAICVKVPPNVKGNTAGVLQKTPVASSVIAYSGGINTVTAAAHGFIPGEVIVVTDGTHAGNAGTFVVATVPTTGTFTYADASGVNSTTATMVTTGVLYQSASGVAGAGTSIPTLSTDSVNGAWDDYFVEFYVETGGTVGTAGIVFTLSLDANRNTGPEIALGTATTYVIPNTGLTIDLTSTQTLLAGDYIRFATIGPAFSDANIQTAIQAVQSSSFGQVQWGSTHILGRFAGSDATTVETYLDTLANGYIYTRGIVDATDALVPIAWGGPGQTETAWLTTIEASYASVSARRICANGGYYNMPSPTSAQSPAVPTVFYRRGLAWALAARQVGIPPQRNAGRVSDGSLGNIVLSPLYYTDGFVYHDELQNPSLANDRFSCVTSRPPSNPGFFILEPFLMSPAGSEYAILPQGQVIDFASSLFIQGCNNLINDDVRTNANGTIYVNDALTQQKALIKPINDDMTQPQIISGALVVVDQTNDVFSTNTENIACTIDSRGYVETINASIGLAQATA
jgi:hypothetical protein